jgi:hypothetical protein
MVSPFIRQRETDHSTTCALCSKTVALSPDPNNLAIAEHAHNCRNWHGRFSDQDVFEQGLKRKGVGENKRGGC